MQMQQGKFQNNEEKKKVDPIKRNNFIFGILLIFTHLLICPLYGFLCIVPTTESTNPYFGSILPIFFVFLLFLLLISFSLLFTYLKRLIWSSIGFNLLITCLTIELFFLINAFWTKVNLGGYYEQFFTSDTHFIYLSSLGIQKQTYGATLSQAIQCALANIVAFSSILGKAGPLEAWFISVIGTIGFELNRRLLVLFDWDYGGTCSIFTYGGFMGLFMSLMLLWRYRNQYSTQKHQLYTGHHFPCALSLMGCLFTVILFPILTIDQQFRKQQNAINPRSLYQSIMLIIFATMASLMMSIGVSTMLNYKISIRDVIQGSIVGSIACSSASLYIGHPVIALVIGSLSGIIQTFLQNYIQKNASLKFHIINTFSFFTFGFQGILGSAFTAGSKAFLVDYKVQNFNLQVMSAPINGFIIGALSAGVGMVFGVLTGSILLFLAVHQRKHHFTDLTYWVIDDGMKLSPVENQQQFPMEQTRKINNIFIIEGKKDYYKHAQI